MTNGAFILRLITEKVDGCEIAVLNSDGLDASLVFNDVNKSYGFWGTLIGY